MRNRHTFVVLATVLLASLAGFARDATCSVPSPLNSIVPVRLLAAPDGSVHDVVTVKDLASNPVTGSQVTLEFLGCTAFSPCPTACVGCVANPANSTVNKFTNAQGVADFDLRVGGSGCPNPPYVRIYADGVLLGLVPFASFDFDGDKTVTLADQAAVHALIGTTDLRADYDGDHVVTSADENLLAAKLGASCDPITPAMPRTWGTLKSIYR